MQGTSNRLLLQEQCQLKNELEGINGKTKKLIII